MHLSTQVMLTLPSTKQQSNIAMSHVTINMVWICNWISWTLSITSQTLCDHGLVNFFFKTWIRYQAVAQQDYTLHSTTTLSLSLSSDHSNVFTAVAQ